MAGLPGSGLGGLFYILLLLWLLIRQLFTQRLEPARFKQLMPLACMSIAMVGVLSITAWLVAHIIGSLPTFAHFVAPSDTTGRWAIILGLMPLISIVLLLCALQVARLTVPRKRLS